MAKRMTDREAADHCETLTNTPGMHDFFKTALERGAAALRSRSGLMQALRLSSFYLDKAVAAGYVGAETDLKKFRRALKAAGKRPSASHGWSSS